MAVGDPLPPLTRHELPESDLAHRREVARRLDGVVKRGTVEWVTEFTLATGTTSTTVTDERVSSDSQISLHPLTPEAAALLGKVWIQASGLVPGTAWSASPVGQFTVNHPNLSGGVVATFRSSCKG